MCSSKTTKHPKVDLDVHSYDTYMPVREAKACGWKPDTYEYFRVAASISELSGDDNGLHGLKAARIQDLAYYTLISALLATVSSSLLVIEPDNFCCNYKGTAVHHIFLCATSTSLACYLVSIWAAAFYSNEISMTPAVFVNDLIMQPKPFWVTILATGMPWAMVGSAALLVSLAMVTIMLNGPEFTPVIVTPLVIATFGCLGARMASQWMAKQSKSSRDKIVACAKSKTTPEERNQATMIQSNASV